MGYHYFSKMRLVINRTKIKRTVCESLLASNQTKRTVGVSHKRATMGDKKQNYLLLYTPEQQGQTIGQP